jgi:integral membrane sensor domain MASE1
MIVMPNLGKRTLEALAIATVYIVTAMPGLLIAMAPGNVAVVWPPSGIALTAMLLLGFRAGAGVWVGAFLVDLLFFVFHDTLMTTAVVTASSIATGSMLQAFLAAFYIDAPSVPTSLLDSKVFSSSRPLRR